MPPSLPPALLSCLLGQECTSPYTLYPFPKLRGCSCPSAPHGAVPGSPSPAPVSPVSLQVVCARCSDYKAGLQYDGNRPNRVCQECFIFLTGHTVLEDREGKHKGILEVSSALPIPSERCHHPPWLVSSLAGPAWPCSRSGRGGSQKVHVLHVLHVLHAEVQLPRLCSLGPNTQGFLHRRMSAPLS